jgi:hypothetical protein
MQPSTGMDTDALRQRLLNNVADLLAGRDVDRLELVNAMQAAAEALSRLSAPHKPPALP